MNKIKFIVVFIMAYVPLLGKTDYLLEKVQEKFHNDMISFEEFKYLGVLSCLDSSLLESKDMLLYSGYYQLYNHMSPFSRIININKVKPILKYINEKRNKFMSNEINSCQEIYSDEVKLFYNSIINNQEYYYNVEDEIMFDENELKQNMRDFLSKGIIDKCRFIDCN